MKQQKVIDFVQAQKHIRWEQPSDFFIYPKPFICLTLLNLSYQNISHSQQISIFNYKKTDIKWTTHIKLNLVNRSMP